MKYLIKLNVVSILYALTILVPFELMINIYRISRLTGWSIGNIEILISVTNIVGFIVGTLLLFSLTKKWMKGRISSFWTVILWIPYFVLIVYIIASLLPTTYEGDTNPSTGLLAIMSLIVFPIYIFIINFIGFSSDDEKKKF